MQINNYQINTGNQPFIIAEMSGNHNQSLDRALAIVDAAADAGVQAIKLQTYTADTITMDAKGGAFEIDDANSLWKGKNLYQLYREAYTPWEWHQSIFDHAKSRGLIAFSSPFDETAVDFLESLDVPAYKIASFENNHIPLIKKVAQTGKPVIVSTGVSSLSDIELVVTTLRNNGCENFALLKCTSTYPALPTNTNLKTIPHLREMFHCEVGLSDHTMGVGVSVGAIVLGATIIEKHVTLNRADGGVDSAFSLEPHELKALVQETERAWQALGRVQYGVQETENKSILFKRSIYAVKDIEAGEIITAEHIRVIRPGNGLHPKYFEELIGKKAQKSFKKGSPFTHEGLA
ncbi:pseudaminic acid synthase [Flavisolibacter ginsengisoli]|jgi:N-acetylneuraminate synthase|uniref:N-acetylneuraminate synthase n=1 Tax=Flavisolibacter ginsengisoli DSM 18119 TaxID=1121884 RepID=A0A1M4VGB8_9BACT|nr:pseudaminic acid synthase [Flavisolibacter ginsengisoli]SHE67952.1 N-acetylneuraminate synthase [Flavisolibacter ginsengisoli DSM 18119]